MIMKEKTHSVFFFFFLTRVFDYRSDELAVDDDRFKLFRNGFLFKDAFFFTIDPETHVQRRKFRTDDLGRETKFRQVHLASVATVDEESRDFAENLNGERGRV